jgi:acetolactate synthase-1/2/3 large subunit
MRWSNVLIQQSDFLVAIGTRLGLQQTGFATDQFAAGATITQVDIDTAELGKPRPRVDYPVHAEAGDFLHRLLAEIETRSGSVEPLWPSWREFCKEVRDALPVVESTNTGSMIDPFDFVFRLGRDTLTEHDLIVPCSSGNTFNVVMQTFPVKRGQRMVTDKGSASMGYGLAGAIGAALTSPRRRVIHFEGDGGFAQNLQELGTVAAQDLNIKSFIFANDGYASIRQMQRHYFNGDYLGCDRATGVGFPSWTTLGAAFGISTHEIDPRHPFSEEFLRLLSEPGPSLFIVPIDPEQTHWPKITSAVGADGRFTSNPLHKMSPALDEGLRMRVLRHLDGSPSP